MTFAFGGQDGAGFGFWDFWDFALAVLFSPLDENKVTFSEALVLLLLAGEDTGKLCVMVASSGTNEASF